MEVINFPMEECPLDLNANEDLAGRRFRLKRAYRLGGRGGVRREIEAAKRAKARAAAWKTTLAAGNTS